MKDDELYVGSMGKEWTTANGEYENNNPQYIKVVSTSGKVRTLQLLFHFFLTYL